MTPAPRAEPSRPRACGRLVGKVGLITGGDSGIGRAVAVAFADEGADVAIVYRNEHADARATCNLVGERGRRCVLIPGDIGDDRFCTKAVRQTVSQLGRLDVLVNNAAEQHPQERIEKITRRQLERTFRTNVFGMFFVTRAAVRHLRAGSSIINTTSVTAYAEVTT